MKRNNYYSHTWWDFVKTWLLLLIGGPVVLVVLGFVLKLIFSCFLIGWEAI